MIQGGIKKTEDLTVDEYITYEIQVKDHYENRKTKKLEDAVRKHEIYVRSLIKDQANEYNKLENFFNGNCEKTQIPQLKYCIDYLTHGLNIPIIEAKCEENPVLKQLRESLYCSILSVTANPESNYLYGPTIRVIMKIIDFYDIFVRTIKPTPAYYHKYRYERYVEYCISLANEGLFVFPTFAYIGATDLLKLRSYPIFAVGLSITLNYVDEYYQTPVEFFVHDINHTRRMFESNLDYMKKRGMNINDMNVKKQYYAESKVCLEEVLYILGNTLEQRPTSKTNVETITIPQITQKREIKKTETRHLKLDDYSLVDQHTPIDTGYSQMIKIILFEITHEDAMPMQKDVICSTILRNSGIETAFPRVDNSARITIDIEKGGSILGFVKYKVRNGFFDSVNAPLEVVAKYFYRTDKQITIATQILLKKLCRTVVPNGSADHDRIKINITDKVGLNLPVQDDVVSHYVPEILLDPVFGDFSEEDVDAIRKKNGITEPNEFTGNRPKPITEQEDILKKLGGNKKTRKNMRNSNR